MMITNLHKNCMGTLSFDGRFDGMRKGQDFIVYPMHDAQDYAKIQSDTRIGMIGLHSGDVMLSRPHPSGAYGVHLAEARPAGSLTGEELLLLKAQILSTAGGRVGNNAMHVYTDNSGAADVFGGAA